VAASVTGLAAPAAAQVERARTLALDPEQQRFVETPPPPPGTSAGDLHAIRVLLAGKEHGAAVKAARRFEKQWGTADPCYPALLIARAEAQLGRGEYEKAYDELQKFLNQFSGIDLTAEALRLEFVIAETYLGGKKRKVWGMRIFSGEDVALRILDEISTNHPDSDFAPLAIKTKADYLARIGDYDLAELDYARLARQYPTGRYHQVAVRRTAESALASYGGLEFDGAPLIEAEERYRDYALIYPAAAEVEGVATILSGVAEQRAAKEFAIGQYYERTEHLGSAIYYYRLVTQQWPETLAAGRARVRLELLGAEPAPAARPMEPPAPMGGAE